MSIDFSNGYWINEPRQFDVTPERVELVTEPGTDFWQRSFYGFRNDNAPALLVESDQNFSFTTRVTFHYQQQFDQCGLVIYLDSENWFKASIEFENEEFSRLGSVVTNMGHSDWATTDIPSTTSIWYRLSRRGPDFLIESAMDGLQFRQMRIFHLHVLGETTREMGEQDPPLPASQAIRFGIYACSPLESSFVATFENFVMEPCLWRAHNT
jgi:regulation of enolase protein 1 (concanavalin A-like superfamily)